MSQQPQPASDDMENSWRAAGLYLYWNSKRPAQVSGEGTWQAWIDELAGQSTGKNIKKQVPFFHVLFFTAALLPDGAVNF